MKVTLTFKNFVWKHEYELNEFVIFLADAIAAWMGVHRRARLIRVSGEGMVSGMINVVTIWEIVVLTAHLVL